MADPAEISRDNAGLPPCEWRDAFRWKPAGLHSWVNEAQCYMYGHCVTPSDCWRCLLNGKTK